MAKLLTYTESKVKLPKTPCPPRHKMWLVYQDTFGYLKNQDDEKVLTSAAALVCIEVYLKHQRGTGILTHLSPRMDVFRSLTDIVSYVHAQKMGTPPYEKAQILTNIFASRESVRRAYYTLALLGMQPEVVRCLPFFRNEVSIDGQGTIKRIDMARGFAEYGTSADKRAVASEFASITQRVMADGFSGVKRDLVCVNTGEKISGGESFPIYPGVPFIDLKDWRNEGRRKRFVIHVKVTDEFDRKILEEVPRLEGVRVSLEKCPSGRYVAVGTHNESALNYAYVHNAETAAMYLAALMARSAAAPHSF